MRKFRIRTIAIVTMTMMLVALVSGAGIAFASNSGTTAMSRQNEPTPPPNSRQMTGARSSSLATPTTTMTEPCTNTAEGLDLSGITEDFTTLQTAFSAGDIATVIATVRDIATYQIPALIAQLNPAAVSVAFQAISQDVQQAFMSFIAGDSEAAMTSIQDAGTQLTTFIVGCVGQYEPLP